MFGKRARTPRTREGVWRAQWKRQDDWRNARLNLPKNSWRQKRDWKLEVVLAASSVLLGAIYALMYGSCTGLGATTIPVETLRTESVGQDQRVEVAGALPLTALAVRHESATGRSVWFVPLVPESSPLPTGERPVFAFARLDDPPIEDGQLALVGHTEWGLPSVSAAFDARLPGVDRRWVKVLVPCTHEPTVWLALIGSALALLVVGVATYSGARIRRWGRGLLQRSRAQSDAPVEAAPAGQLPAPRAAPTRAILLAFANARDGADRTFLRNLTPERIAVTDVLTSVEVAHGCRVIAESEVTAPRLFELIGRHADRLTILHFAGHATDGALQLEGEVDGDGLRPVGVGGLARQLAHLPELALVVLNGCGTRALVEQLHAGCRACIVATDAAIDDATAAGFARQFYSGLASGLTIRRAFAAANDLLDSLAVTDDGPASRLLRPAAPAEDIRRPWGLHVHPDHPTGAAWRLTRPPDLDSTDVQGARVVVDDVLQLRLDRHGAELEVRLRNVGDRLATLHRIWLQPIERRLYRPMDPIPDAARYMPTNDGSPTPRDAEGRYEVFIAQEVDPGTSDRFVVGVRFDSDPAHVEVVDLKLMLVYNRGRTAPGR